MKELRVRLLLLFTLSATLLLAGHFDTRAPETFVLTEDHLILRPDQLEAEPQTFVAETANDELLPPADAADLEPATLEVTGSDVLPPLEEAPAIEAEPVLTAETEETAEMVTAWGPTKLGEKKRVKTYLAERAPASTEPSVTFAMPLAPMPTLAKIPTYAPKTSVMNARPMPSAQPATRVVAATAAPVPVAGKVRAAAPPTCSLQIESPNGGETLSQSVGERVLWKSVGTSGDVRLKLFRGEEDLGSLALVRDDGSTLIRVPDLVEPGAGYRLRLEDARDPSCFDESDAEFTIAP